MQCTTGWGKCHWQWGVVVHTLAVLGLMVLAGVGMYLESSGGWVACPPQLAETGEQGEQRRRRRRGRFAWRAGWGWMRRSWMVVAARSEGMMVLVFLTGREEWRWLCGLPWVVWLWKGLGIAWPGLGRQPVYCAVGRLWEEASRWALIGLGVTWLGQQICVLGDAAPYGLSTCGASKGIVVHIPSIEVEQDEMGTYHVRIRGEFELHVDGNVEMYRRMLVIFLGQLEVEGETRGSRRTRDGRTPFVRQQQLAEWFGVVQPNISEWFQCWLEQDWRRLLSQKWGEVLTQEVRQRVVHTWAKFPWWQAPRVWKHLQAQGSQITLKQVRQVAWESGWSTLRQALSRVYVISAASFRPQDEWLVSQLLAQVQWLVEQLEALGGLTVEQKVDLADLGALCEELNLRPAVPRRPLPWVLRMEHLLLGQWEAIEDGTVHCIYCGTTDVSRKSRKPRLKKYVDKQGEIETVAVYRYYCHNPACKYTSFTNLPPNLIPHSQWTLDHHVAALQMYEWSRSVYWCTSQMLGVSKMTAYRWVSGFGYELLPVAALFGVVRSSGVVGVDEKYVLVPKNDKSPGKMKRWMYVYFAVDCYTYDLLHIEIYPYNTKPSAHAFLLALRAKGYHPRVIVTDMRVDYSDLVAQVFPGAVHHECIFHALQEVHRRIREVYGTDYAKMHPEVVTLKEEIDHIFDARTKRTAQRRYDKVLAQQEKFVLPTPEAHTIFALLERHWPRLVNAIESRHIPTTNNTTEEVIRIFTQHYKTFCGFESIDSARLYLGVFEKVYRFSPFSNDAQERIRGKCPLELAGYEVQKLPMAQLFRGLALQWPASAFQELVPNV
jgi:transposase-like protein